uniref:Uncharacterized protein n=1 Tax=Meloidogyne enterolobii TaxID=390850 RepID=A0A6V7UAA9_MELEN|nr:unnamed protein product [Meloidogyne enterolobii]
MALDEEVSKELLERISTLAERIENVDIIKRQQTVLDNLKTLRIGKKKLLHQLQLLLEKEADVQVTNDLIQKLLQSFNELRKQEQEFTCAMREVVVKFCGDLNDVLPKLNEVQQILKNDKDNKFSEFNLLEVERLTLKLKNVQEMIFGFNEMFKEAEDASGLLDEQLKTRLSIYFEKQKRKSLVQRLNDTTLSISKDKNAHHQKFVNAHCNSNSERKQRQLERLRREAVKRGIVNNNDNHVECQETSTVSLEPKKEDLENVEKEFELKATIEDDERIPPIPHLPNQEELGTSSSVKNKDDLRSKISERFSSLAARKHKMRLIQSRLSNLQQQKMETTYDEALNRYKFLSEMRNKLENLQNSGFTGDDSFNSVGDENQALNQNYGLPKNGEESQDVKLNKFEEPNQDELLAKEFVNVNCTVEKTANIDGFVVGSSTNSIDKTNFSTIENSLEGIEKDQTAQFGWTGNENQNTSTSKSQITMEEKQNDDGSDCGIKLCGKELGN